MGRGQDHHPSVGQEGKPHCQRGYILFYWSAGLPLIGVVGWDPSHGSGAVSSVGMPWAWGGKQRRGQAVSSCQPGQPGAAPGCFSQVMVLRALLSLVPSHRHRLDVAPETHLAALPKIQFITGKCLDPFFAPSTCFQQDGTLPALAGVG